MFPLVGSRNRRSRVLATSTGTEARWTDHSNASSVLFTVSTKSVISEYINSHLMHYLYCNEKQISHLILFAGFRTELLSSFLILLETYIHLDYNQSLDYECRLELFIGFPLLCQSSFGHFRYITSLSPYRHPLPEI